MWRQLKGWQELSRKRCRVQQTYVVTGASSGIGLATCRLLVERGHRVFATVRRPEDAASLRGELGEALVPVLLDVRDPESIGRLVSEVDAALGSSRLAGLVNNAGVAVPGPLEHLSAEEWNEQFEVNLTGPLRLIQGLLPALGTDPARTGKPGRIINISSVGGKTASPFLGAYSASKAALDSLSDSLRRELGLFGIPVVVIAPSYVKTPIWRKAPDPDTARAQARPYLKAMHLFHRYALGEAERYGLPPEKVAASIVKALMDSSPPVYVPLSSRPFLDFTLPRWLPSRWLDAVVAWKFGLRPSRNRSKEI